MGSPFPHSQLRPNTKYLSESSCEHFVSHLPISASKKSGWKLPFRALNDINALENYCSLVSLVIIIIIM
jgi:hypothetical protein